MKDNILIVEDKESLALMIKKVLHKQGYEAKTASNLKEAKDLLSKGVSISLILTDLKLPDGDGLTLLSICEDRNIPIIIMTAYGSINTAVKAVKEGAFDFITKPFDIDNLVEIIKKALSDFKPVKEDKSLKYNDELIGVSSLWKEVMDKANKVANQKTTVLLFGESGVGKELIARYIHKISQRAPFPFIPVNCSAIPKELVENEIFGHEKGAFTGAVEFKPGRFELSDKGTIFLDEIGDMEQGLQSKLLRILQDAEFMRVGGTKSIKIDTRVIAATNKDLSLEVEKGNFRRDLYYRINVFPIAIPPLRERIEDIEPIALYFLKTISRELNKEGLYYSNDTLLLLKSNQWFGNVRELRNAIERAIILCEDKEIRPELFQGDYSKIQSQEDLSLQSISSQAQKTAERERIISALKETGGNKTKAAEILKVSYKTLLNKIKEYGI